MKKNLNTKQLIQSVIPVFILLFFAQTGLAQTNVTLYSVSPTSAQVGQEVVITGTNLLYCAPVYAGGNLNPNCNVQFHDINLRRSTTSGIEDSNTQVRATVADGLCPGTTTIKVGELADFSNAIPFTILDQGNVPAGCRVITSIAPTSGTYGNTVTINGRNLHANVQLYDSSFGKTDVTGTMNAGGTQVDFNIPNGINPGTYSVRVGPSVNDVSNGLPFAVTGDRTAPYISNIKINNITTSGATVLWDTSEPADSQVEICPTLIRCSTNAPLNSSLVLSHVVNLSGLTANTRYYLWIKSKDGAGNLVTGGPITLRTLSVATPVPSVVSNVIPITNVQVTNITRYTATITWNTDRPADSSAGICFMGFFCSFRIADPNLVTAHTYTLTGLRAGSKYSFEVRSVDPTGAIGYSTMMKFTTSPSVAISNLQASGITQNSATITWQTNYPADSELVTCTSAFLCYWSAKPIIDPNLTLNHSMNMTNLKPSTRYYYRVISVEPTGESASSNLRYFNTP